MLTETQKEWLMNLKADMRREVCKQGILNGQFMIGNVIKKVDSKTASEMWGYHGFLARNNNEQLKFIKSIGGQDVK